MPKSKTIRLRKTEQNRTRQEDPYAKPRSPATLPPGQEDPRARLPTHHGLEARVQLDEERRLASEGQDPLLDHGALHVVVLDDDVLLQDLDGVQLVRALRRHPHALSQHS